MNKSDLTKALSKEMDLPIRKAEEIVDMVFDTMSSCPHRGRPDRNTGFRRHLPYDSTKDTRAGTPRLVKKRWWRQRGFRFSRRDRT